MEGVPEVAGEVGVDGGQAEGTLRWGRGGGVVEVDHGGDGEREREGGPGEAVEGDVTRPDERGLSVPGRWVRVSGQAIL